VGDSLEEIPPQGPAMPLLVHTSLGRLSFIGATTVFGTPADVTLEEIALEVMHPADGFTDAAVRGSAAVAGGALVRPPNEAQIAV
jgi:hypothetical protein